jgi:hypothetical protein
MNGTMNIPTSMEQLRSENYVIPEDVGKVLAKSVAREAFENNMSVSELETAILRAMQTARLK